MKKILLSCILTVFCLIALNAQKKNNFEFGLHFGIPIVKTPDIEPGFEDYIVKDEYNFNIGLTVGYYFGITDKIKVGPLMGYDHFITNFDEVDDTDYGDGGYYDDYYYNPSLNVDADGFGFILIGPSAKFYFANKFYGGLDIGYAHSIDLDAGGLFFRPRVSFSTNRIDLYVFYKGINIAEGKYYYDENFHLGSAGIGVMFKF